MKGLFKLVLLGALSILASCKPDDVIRIEERQNSKDPLCGDAATCSTKMDWDIVLAKGQAPSMVRITINDKIRIDDCNVDFPRSGIQRGPSYSTIFLRDFIPVSSDSKFKLTIHDLGSCYNTKIYHENADQAFKLRTVEGKKRVWIEISN